MGPMNPDTVSDRIDAGFQDRDNHVRTKVTPMLKDPDLHNPY